jgi:hypothetical protein
MSYREPLAVLMILACAGCGPDRSRTGEASPPSTGSARRESAASAERGGPPGAVAGAAIRDPVELSAAAQAGGASASFAGLGECHSTDDASIYEVPATMWSARVDAPSGELPYVNLTLWQPKGTRELQVSLGLTVHGHTHRITTVKGAEQHGSARARVEPAGTGGVLRVEGADADGRPVTLSVRCSRFTEPVAEGG